MLCWTRSDKTIWIDRVRNLLHTMKEDRNIPRTIKRSKAVWIGHILRRNCCLTHVMEGKIQGRVAVTGR